MKRLALVVLMTAVAGFAVFEKLPAANASVLDHTTDLAFGGPLPICPPVCTNGDSTQAPRPAKSKLPMKQKKHIDQ